MVHQILAFCRFHCLFLYTPHYTDGVCSVYARDVRVSMDPLIFQIDETMSISYRLYNFVCVFFLLLRGEKFSMPSSSFCLHCYRRRHCMF